MFAIPDRTAHVTKFADWLEFGAIQSPNGRIGFSTLVSASDISTEEQSEDISDEEIWEDELVLATQNEIIARAKCVGPDYPFAIDEHGNFLVLADPITPIGSVYLFCLFLSHVTDRTIVPAHWLRPSITVCVTFSKLVPRLPLPVMFRDMRFHSAGRALTILIS